MPKFGVVEVVVLQRVVVPSVECPGVEWLTVVPQEVVDLAQDERTLVYFRASNTLDGCPVSQ